MTDSAKTPTVEELMKMLAIVAARASDCAHGLVSNESAMESYYALELAITMLVKERDDLASRNEDPQEYIRLLVKASQEWLKDRDQLRAERDALKALQDEQDSLLDSCGTILCRHQINHERFDGCLYCDLDQLRAENEGLKQTLKLIQDAAIQVIAETDCGMQPPSLEAVEDLRLAVNPTLGGK